ncbi:ecto-ADP-ribosyltransferase 5-like [Erpetoichthys calabaricus]|uniref:NAD(P)(+)--arginine ADP-ribosyltransferase n=1 Tax=Erpetoichthys calabaricus TaxID=27687 RepID=A0A8C4RLT0_ERPCA|nr:ecto-ADP-ribosyltransferase 5-like [Erpetoichthys calabaricus]
MQFQMSSTIYTVLLVCFLIFVNDAKSSSYMNEKSYDDDYKGCLKEREKEITEHYLFHELNNSYLMDFVWENASSILELWMPEGLDYYTAIAVLAYTGEHMYYDFNVAVAKGVREVTAEYFRSMHFLLTKAIQTLKSSDCMRTYRGISEELRPKKGETFRFGRFASTSKDFKVAEEFGNETVFNITTCHGADISEFSVFRNESEVLIPPYEEFVVKETNGRHITLESHKVTVNYRCWPLSGSSGRSTLPLNVVALLMAIHLLLNSSILQ